MSKDLAKTTHCLLFCNGGSCIKNGAEQLTKEVRAYLRIEGLYHSTHTIKTLCMGRCADGPNMIVLPDTTWYKEMTTEKAIEVVEQHIKKNEPVKHTILFQPGMAEVQSPFKLLPDSKKDFHVINDKELGQLLVAQADAGEMNLYPMLMAIFIKFYTSCEISVAPFETVFYLDKPALIHCQQQIARVCINNHLVEFVIGPVNKNDTYELQQEKLFFVDIYKKLEAPFKYGIRFRTKAGETKLNVTDSSNGLKLWEHFVEVYLEKQMDQVRLIKEPVA